MSRSADILGKYKMHESVSLQSSLKNLDNKKKEIKTSLRNLLKQDPDLELGNNIDNHNELTDYLDRIDRVSKQAANLIQDTIDDIQRNFKWFKIATK